MTKSCKLRALDAIVESRALIKENSISMSEGCPNPECVPIVDASIKLRDGSILEVTKDEMKAALQYGETAGKPTLRKWLTEFQRRVHNPPTMDERGLPSSMDLIITSGCSESIDQTVDAIVEEGDAVITEEYLFPLIFLNTQTNGGRIITVKTDRQGMSSSDLDQLMSTWNELTDGKRPKVLYCISSGSNPVGITCSLARKQEIYQIAHKYDLLIMEDDPYYLLQFNKPNVASFLSLDVDGRVIRFDSFSKIITSGARLGYISGPKQLLDKLVLHMSSSTSSASCLVQIFVLKLLEYLGHDGYLRHGDDVSSLYHKNAISAHEIAKKHLEGLAEWSMPDGGIFIWLRILGIQDCSRIIANTAEKGVAILGGSALTPDKRKSNCLRISFSDQSKENFEKGFAILASAIKEEHDRMK
ncbi:kynurenine/alpha-aminoadipate aminotransferase, mitochondrial-like [Gigantopelta aegis]|uniref:kynurenine/alpha-aminoadipate aminotransferase, mitochondrial-like n=1 Tax=Gigantopelta aegis TaxID=1735272 RepID=UPI001B88B159|nr:kynurenine/alpha-aminoadipate aminotransferase, mitochondrial-like [Gigantopelta aegis]